LTWRRNDANDLSCAKSSSPLAQKLIWWNSTPNSFRMVPLRNERWRPSKGPVNSFNGFPTVEKLAPDLVRECGGFPLVTM
jgi:hypothetical protein